MLVAAFDPHLTSPFQGEEQAAVRDVSAADSFPPPNKGEDQGGGVTHRIAPSLTKKARALRTNLTEAEKKLWYHLRQKQMGHKFRRQFPVGNYIVDFACIEKKLIVELDGGQHATQQAYDEKRTLFLETQGFHILRFWNNEVTENLEAVLSSISHSLTKEAIQ